MDQGAIHVSTCSTAQGKKSQIRASILKDQEITVAQIGQAESVLWTYRLGMTFNTKNNNNNNKKKKKKNISCGQVKMSLGQVFFIKIVLYLPEWASGDKNLCSTLGMF